MTRKTTSPSLFSRLCTLLLVLGACALASTAVARQDEVRLTADYEGQIWRGLSIKGESLVQYDNSRLILHETLVLGGWKFNPYVSVWAGYRLVRERPSRHEHLETEHRPTFELGLSAPEFWTLKFDFRSRVEVRDKKGAQPYLRFRERLRLRTSWSVTDFQISPYVSTELFFSDKPKQDDADVFDRNRSQFGLTFKPMPSLKNLSAALYFMVQHDMSDNSSTWDPTNVIGVTLSYKF